MRMWGVITYAVVVRAKGDVSKMIAAGVEWMFGVKLHSQLCYRMCVAVGVSDRERLGGQS